VEVADVRQLPVEHGGEPTVVRDEHGVAGAEVAVQQPGPPRPPRASVPASTARPTAASPGAEIGSTVRRTSTSQADTVRALLGADPVDLDRAGVTLGYDLRQHHVALLVAPLVGPADVRRELDQLIAPVAARALAIPSGEGSWWAWLGFSTAPTDDEMARIMAVPVTTVLVGMGEPAQGRDGFRRTLAQAREAERTGRLALRPSPTVTRHRHIEIAACSAATRTRPRHSPRPGSLIDHTFHGP
jgi:hypothetical protein